ncbi:Rossmann fold domain-containing protein [Novosphingobium piscinae]|uniref:Short chain dehydrogenase-like proteobacteria domain-containing protein n=1 Tax=Novosphingobium piscinae TaxID=1507448 RepID=A0A7X1KP69_9SPHN|nr:hypothetical protein [Novosphingobium piscinae]MBC2668444.1 hypothetical protein [Novosphingobium piscinae]
MLFAVGPLPDEPLLAASQFHVEVLPRVLAQLAGGVDHLTLVFAPADHAHEDWRRAAVATLAREQAPVRVNALSGDSAQGIAAAEAYVVTAPGLTGHYLALDPNGAG